jgi:hypothetical protein
MRHGTPPPAMGSTTSISSVDSPTAWRAAGIDPEQADEDVVLRGEGLDS